MKLSEKFQKIVFEPNLQKQIALIDALDEEEAKEILKAYIRFLKRDQQEI